MAIIFSNLLLESTFDIRKLSKGKKVKNGPKMFNMVLNVLQCSQMVLNGLKKSPLIQLDGLYNQV